MADLKNRQTVLSHEALGLPQMPVADGINGSIEWVGKKVHPLTWLEWTVRYLIVLEVTVGFIVSLRKPSIHSLSFLQYLPRPVLVFHDENISKGS
jgi:hypothetical protein